MIINQVAELQSVVTKMDSNFFLGGVSGVAISLMQTFLTATSYSAEVNPETTAQYSKFAILSDSKETDKTSMIPSRKGMTIIYLPAFVVSAILGCNVSSLVGFLPPPTIATYFLAIHFLKRLVEVYCIHEYSGKVKQDLSTTIGVYYALVSLLICCVANPVQDDFIRNVGTGLFSIGLIGNFYHHNLLAELRRSSSKEGIKSSKTYVAPKGGLFDYVAAPHYLFELIGWLGIAVVAQHANAYLVFASMTSYLSGRAFSQNSWNRSKFSTNDWPKSRKNIVPFVI